MYKYKLSLITGQINHSLVMSRQMDMHSYNTRNKDLIRLPRVKRNWGKQRLAYHAVNDFNSLDTSIRKSSSLVIFKRNLLSSF